MPARKSLHMDNSHDKPPASRIPVPAGKPISLTGAASLKAGKANTATRAEAVPQTELEKLDYLRSKLEQSADAFIRAMTKLQEILPAEGSKEQGHLIGSAADLRAELKRNRELTSRMEENEERENKDINNHIRGPVEMGGSYKFLKSIMG